MKMARNIPDQRFRCPFVGSRNRKMPVALLIGNEHFLFLQPNKVHGVQSGKTSHAFLYHST